MSEEVKEDEIFDLIKKKVTEEIEVPISIFDDKKHVLESLVKYLKEDLGLSFHEIAMLLARDDRTIWTTYNNSKKMKKTKKKSSKKSKKTVPISIFSEKKLSILESVIIYLKERGMNHAEIASLLKRDQRNIWTLAKRAEEKLKK